MAHSFTDYVQAVASHLGQRAPADGASRAMFNVDTRWIELRHAPGIRGVHMVALIAVAPTSHDLKTDLMAQFNLHNLFKGGYALIAPPDTNAVYLLQSRSISLCDATRVDEDFAEFSRRVSAAATWYLTQDAAVAA
jgi:hypothetical protein